MHQQMVNYALIFIIVSLHIVITNTSFLLSLSNIYKLDLLELYKIRILLKRNCLAMQHLRRIS
jgi:hypothetical protein